MLLDDAFKVVKTIKKQWQKIGYRFLRSKKVLVKEQEVVNVKAGKVMNVESRPFPLQLRANQDTNEEKQRRKTSPLNFETEKEKDVETDPPAKDLGMEAENLYYISYSAVFSIFQFPIMHSVCPQSLHKLLL